MGGRFKHHAYSCTPRRCSISWEDARNQAVDLLAVFYRHCRCREAAEVGDPNLTEAAQADDRGRVAADGCRHRHWPEHAPPSIG